MNPTGNQDPKTRQLLAGRRLLFRTHGAAKAFNQLKKKGCDPGELTPLLFNAAFARYVVLARRSEKPITSSPAWALLWGLTEQDLLRFPRDLRRMADDIEKILRSPVLSPSKIVPVLLGRKLEKRRPDDKRAPHKRTTEAVMTRALRQSNEEFTEGAATRLLPRVPWLLRFLAAYLDVFGPDLRAATSPARLMRQHQDEKLSLLFGYVATATKQTPAFAETSLLLRAALSAFGAAETGRRTFGRKALEVRYRRQSRSTQMATTEG